MPTDLTIRTHPGLPLKSRRLLRRMFTPIRNAVGKVRNELSITFVPATRLEAHNGSYGFGVFIWTNPKRLRIIVAAHHSRSFMPTDLDYICIMAQTVAHEIVHYHQWRDGRPIVERGVEMRSRRLAATIIDALFPEGSTDAR